MELVGFVCLQVLLYHFVYKQTFQQFSLITTVAATTSAGISQHQRTHGAGAAMLSQRPSAMVQGDILVATQVVVALISIVLLRKWRCSV
jgi:hypothetical protein